MREIQLPGNPGGIALSPDGKRLYVTTGSVDGRVLVVEAKSGKVIVAIKAGHTPRSPVISPDGKRLYTCNRFSGDLSVFDLEAGKEVASVRLPPGEPYSAAVTPDGKRLIVVNHVNGDAIGDYVAVKVSIVDTDRHAQRMSRCRPTVDGLTFPTF